MLSTKDLFEALHHHRLENGEQRAPLLADVNQQVEQVPLSRSKLNYWYRTHGRYITYWGMSRNLTTLGGHFARTLSCEISCTINLFHFDSELTFPKTSEQKHPAGISYNE